MYMDMDCAVYVGTALRPLIGNEVYSQGLPLPLHHPSLPMSSQSRVVKVSIVLEGREDQYIPHVPFVGFPQSLVQAVGFVCSPPR